MVTFLYFQWLGATNRTEAINTTARHWRHGTSRAEESLGTDRVALGHQQAEACPVDAGCTLPFRAVSAPKTWTTPYLGGSFKVRVLVFFVLVPDAVVARMDVGTLRATLWTNLGRATTLCWSGGDLADAADVAWIGDVET